MVALGQVGDASSLPRSLGNRQRNPNKQGERDEDEDNHGDHRCEPPACGCDSGDFIQ